MNRENALKRVFALLLCMAMIVTYYPATLMAYAEDAGGTSPTLNVQGSKKADPTVLKSDRKTTVTLSLPSGEYKNAVDIVFAMDSSSSAQNSTVFKEAVNNLFNSIISNNPNIDLKVGVIRFRGRAHDAVKYLSDGAYSGLTPYNDSTKGVIEEALNMSEPDIKAAFGSGSNTHGGIDIADEWLAADTELDDSQKYLVLLTDGKTYIWNNEDNEPTTIYSQFYKWTRGIGKGAIQNYGKPALNQTAGSNKQNSTYAVDVIDKSGKSNVIDFDTFEALYSSNNEELVGVTKWDQPCRYADDKTDLPDGEVIPHTVTNGAELFGSNNATYGDCQDYQKYFEFIPNERWKDIPYLEANPFEVIVDGDTYTFDTNSVNPDYYQYHVDCLQKGMYKAGHLWSDVNKKYNCATIAFYGKIGSGLKLVHPFLDWLKANSDYGASITDSAKVEELFENIDNSIRYMVGRGVVTDKIADEFDLVIPEGGASPFRMTYNGTALESAAAGDNTWNFGTAGDDGKYPYVVHYDADSNSFTWTINVPIENAKPVALSYDLVLKEEYPAGEYDTNKSAVLVYDSTDGKYTDQEYVFEIPKVEYITYTVIYTDGVEGEEVFADKKTEGLDEGDATPSFGADPVREGYRFTGWEPEVKNVVNAEDANENREIIYTATWEELTDISVKKVWNDAEDQDGIRPESVTFVLKGDGKEVGNITLDGTVDQDGEASAWTATWKGLPKYSAVDTPVVYTAEEIKTDVITGTDRAGTYAFEVEDNEDGTFTITNTHTPEKTKLDGMKVWNDAKYFVDGKAIGGYKRPAIVVHLYADGTELADKAITLTEETAETDKDGSWIFSFTDLPKYKNHGTEIKYTIQETDEDGNQVAGQGYIGVVNGNEITNTPDEEKTVNDDATGITIRKVDAKSDSGAGIAGAVFTLSGGDLEAPVEYMTGTDGTVRFDFKGYTSKENVDSAKTSTYTLKETKAPAGYELNSTEYIITVKEEQVSVKLKANVWQWLYNLISSTTPDFKDGVLTVSDTPVITQITANKTWNDADDQDKLRPESIEVQLLADGAKYGDPVALSESNKWSTTWTDLVTYKDGKEIKYTVEEVKVPEGYTCEVSELKESKDADGNTVYTVDVVNKHGTANEKELVITKNLTNFVKHEGEAVKATFAFRITGDSETKGAYSNVVAMEFNGAGTEEVTVTGLPGDIRNLKVEEIVSGNYTPSTDGVKLDEADGKYKVTFTNKFNGTGFKTGTINNYKRGNDGKYHANGQGFIRSTDQTAEKTQPNGSGN